MLAHCWRADAGGVVCSTSRGTYCLVKLGEVDLLHSRARSHPPPPMSNQDTLQKQGAWGGFRLMGLGVDCCKGKQAKWGQCSRASAPAYMISWKPAERDMLARFIVVPCVRKTGGGKGSARCDEHASAWPMFTLGHGMGL